MSGQNYICERCGGVATTCHHKVWLTPHNIHDPNVSLNFDNLCALCDPCHQLEHMGKTTRIYYDKDGEVERVQESKDVRIFENDRQIMKSLMKNLKPPGSENGIGLGDTTRGGPHSDSPGKTYEGA